MIWRFLNNLLGGVFGSAIQSAERAYVATKTSEVEKEKVRAEVAEAALAHAIEDKRIAQQIRLATAGFAEMRVLTFFIAAPFVLHLNLVALDTCFSLGWRIPAFPPPFDMWEGTILLSFFGVQAGTKIATTLATAFSARR